MKKMILVLLVLSIMGYGATAQMMPHYGPGFGLQASNRLDPLPPFSMPMHTFGFPMMAQEKNLTGMLEILDGFYYLRTNDGAQYILSLPRLGGLTFNNLFAGTAKVHGFVSVGRIQVIDMMVNDKPVFVYYSLPRF